MCVCAERGGRERDRETHITIIIKEKEAHNLRMGAWEWLIKWEGSLKYPMDCINNLSIPNLLERLFVYILHSNSLFCHRNSSTTQSQDFF